MSVQRGLDGEEASDDVDRFIGKSAKVSNIRKKLVELVTSFPIGDR